MQQKMRQRKMPSPLKRKPIGIVAICPTKIFKALKKAQNKPGGGGAHP